MPHPQFCHLVLDTLITYTNKFNQTSLVSHVLLKMISIAKQNIYNATAMYTQGMVELILTRFQQVLRLPVNYKDSFPVELTLLLDLFLVISKHSFHAKELRLCLRLFQEESPPVDLLLHTLTELAENLVMQPSYIICFPVITSTLASDLELTARSLSGDTLSISVQVNAGTREDISFKWDIMFFQLSYFVTFIRNVKLKFLYYHLISIGKWKRKHQRMFRKDDFIKMPIYLLTFRSFMVQNGWLWLANQNHL